MNTNDERDFTELSSKLRVLSDDVEKNSTNEIEEVEFPMNSRNIFISHRSTDKEIADILFEFLVVLGIPRKNIFCSSLPGNDVKEKIPFEVKAAIKNSVLNIAILSSEYYLSAFCLNEAGIIWYLEDIPAIPIALPEINSSNMFGFLGNEYKLRSLDNEDDLSYIYETACNATFTEALNIGDAMRETKKTKSKYLNHLESRNIVLATQPNTDLLSEITTDDEKIVMYYVLTKSIRKVKKCNLLEWLRINEVYNVDIDNAFDLLTTIENNIISNDTLELNAVFFRRCSLNSSTLVEEYESCFKKKIELSSEKFQDLWVADIIDDYIKLFLSYIMDERVVIYGARWMAENQVYDIKQWESKNSLDSSLSDNYGSCLEFFIHYKFVYENSWTSHGNPREYKLCLSLEHLLFENNELYTTEIMKAKEGHTFDLPF